MKLHMFVYVNLQCMKRLADESRADEELVVSMWYHETQRLMRDRICRHADLCWFDETLEKTVSEVKYYTSPVSLAYTSKIIQAISYI